MIKTKNWMNISNKLSNIVNGKFLNSLVLISAIVGIIGAIIFIFSENIGGPIIIIAMVPIYVGCILMIADLIITDLICNKILIPKYNEKQIGSVDGIKVSENSMEETSNSIKFTICENENELLTNEKIVRFTRVNMEAE